MARLLICLFDYDATAKSFAKSAILNLAHYRGPVPEIIFLQLARVYGGVQPYQPGGCMRRHTSSFETLLHLHVCKNVPFFNPGTPYCRSMHGSYLITGSLITGHIAHAPALAECFKPARQRRRKCRLALPKAVHLRLHSWRLSRRRVLWRILDAYRL